MAGPPWRPTCVGLELELPVEGVVVGFGLKCGGTYVGFPEVEGVSPHTFLGVSP